MVNYGGCGKFLAAQGGATCTLCPTRYHKACLNIPDKAQISKDWVCPNCKRNNRRGDNSQTPVKSICDSPPSTEKSPQSGPSNDLLLVWIPSRGGSMPRAAQLEGTIIELRNELNDRNRESLLADLDIAQLPEEKGVSVVQSVMVLAGRLGVTAGATARGGAARPLRRV
ncbi:hypothetical protein ACJJTC_011487 [Scirpophaga incertulas]